MDRMDLGWLERLEGRTVRIIGHKMDEKFLLE